MILPQRKLRTFWFTIVNRHSLKNCSCKINYSCYFFFFFTLILMGKIDVIYMFRFVIMKCISTVSLNYLYSIFGVTWTTWMKRIWVDALIYLTQPACFLTNSIKFIWLNSNLSFAIHECILKSNNIRVHTYAVRCTAYRMPCSIVHTVLRIVHIQLHYTMLSNTTNFELNGFVCVYPR